MMDPPESRILVVDDDIDLTVMLGQYLRAEGLEVDALHNGSDALGMIPAIDRFDAVILDVMLPDFSGVDVLCRIRAESDVPVIMLTAQGSRIERARGIELGADDYIAKPYYPRELVARIRAVLRRRSTRPANRSALHGGRLRIERTTREAWLGDTKLDLTPTEFEVLTMLLEVPGTAVTKEDLSSHVLGRAWKSYDRSLDVHISNLRQKIAADSSIAIATVRGVGYRFIA